MIYLDHAAATPVSPKALQAMKPYFSEKFFNPSAAYLPSVEIRREYERAKDEIAHVIGAKGAEVLISAVEHAAVLENAKRASKYQTIDVDQNGRVDLEDFHRKLTNKTQFVSVCLVSSETGTVQPISDLARIIVAERQRRALAGESTPLYLHCDASQGPGLMEVKVGRLGVDLLTINAAKVYGPKGVGALYVGHSVRLKPLTVGGGQEMGLRSGTENVPGVIGFAAALTEAEKHIYSERKRLQELKRILVRNLADLPNIKFIGNPKTQLPNILAVSLPGIDAERVIFALEDKEVYLSTGAACAASKGIKSPTLRAIGLSDAEIAGSLRISLGKLNDIRNVTEACQIIREAVQAELDRSR